MEDEAKRILTIIAKKRLESMYERNITPEYCILDSNSFMILERKGNDIYQRACETIDIKARVYGLVICVVESYEDKEIIEVR